MNKNELVHLHALLARVAEEYVDRGLATRDDFAAYHALDTTPMALRKSRADHEAAARTLAETLADLSAPTADRRSAGAPVLEEPKTT
jgi:hypothetical protein